VDKVKRILHPMKIGHAGTLDPLASGVLPLALGEATKLVSFGMDKAKTYAFEVTWGAERDSDDMEGFVTVTSDKRPAEADIQAILPQFTGRIQQSPPAFSAIKIDGVRAYAMARAGQTPEIQPREVRVDSLTLLVHSGDKTTFLCECGKGTYIRSLARDFGRALGCYGHVSALRRTKVGAFSENDAISLEKLAEIVHNGDLGFIKPPQAMLDDILAINLNAVEAALLLRGQSFPSPLHVADDQLVVCEKEGVLVAVAKNKGGLIKSERVFNLL
jgi:tRNA pseudouridine55 synthase